MSDDPNTLAERVSRAVASALSRNQGNDYDDEPSGRSVPYDRFRSVVEQRNQTREEIAELGRQLETLQEAYDNQLDKLKSDTAAQVAGLAQQHQEDLLLNDAGIRDSLGRSAVRQAWEAQPEAARGKSPAQWWQQQLEGLSAHRSNPDEAPAVEIPRILQGYVPEVPQAPKSTPPQVDRGAARKSNTSANDRLAALPADATIADVMRAARGT
jgi:hypothetical protein